MVRISTLPGSPAATMSRVASMPSRPGIRTSMTTTSGRSAEHMVTAATPLASTWPSRPGFGRPYQYAARRVVGEILLADLADEPAAAEHYPPFGG